MYLLAGEALATREIQQQVPPLRSPGFPVELDGVGEFHAPSLRKGAHVALSSAAWQEIRVRSGRDDNLF
jgi:hypothetical protein